MRVRTPRSCWKDYWVAGKKGLSWGLAGREGLDSGAAQGKNKPNTSMLECSSVAGGFASSTVFSKVYAVNIYKDYRHKEVTALRKMSRPGVTVSLGAVGTADTCSGDPGPQTWKRLHRPGPPAQPHSWRLCSVLLQARRISSPQEKGVGGGSGILLLLARTVAFL